MTTKRIDDMARLQLEVDELKSRLEQLTNPNPVPVAPVMSKYSALQSGNHTFSHPPIPIDSAAGFAKREVKNALDSLYSLSAGVVHTRGGTCDVFGRKDEEGGMFLRITLPASGVLAPSGVNEIFQQIVQVAFQNFPAARVDWFNMVSVGLGSPVSASDGKHILTVRCLVPTPPGISPVNNPHNCRDTNNNESGSKLDDD